MKGQINAEDTGRLVGPAPACTAANNLALVSWALSQGTLATEMFTWSGIRDPTPQTRVAVAGTDLPGAASP